MATKKKRGKRRPSPQKVLAKYQRPGVMEEIERPAQEAMVIASKKHDEILRRSRELAHTRVFRSQAA